MSPETFSAPVAMNDSGKSSDNVLLTVAIVAVLVSAFGLIFVYSGIFNVEQVLLQPSDTDTGTAQVTIAQEARIRFAHKNLNWGSGYVEPGTRAVLDTFNGLKTNFNTPNPALTQGFLIENSGTVDLSIDISAASGPFLDGDTPTYQYRVNNCWTGSSYDCIGSPDQLLLQAQDTAAACGDQDPGSVGMWAGFVNMPIAGSGNPEDRICGDVDAPGVASAGMGYLGTNDELEVNIKLDIADDISVGLHQNTITVTGTSV